MPPDLDPAYAAFRPVRRESPTEGMRRIERDLRSKDFEYQEQPRTQPNRLGSSAGRSLDGYNVNVGAQGPLSAGLIGAGDLETGKPQMVGGRVQAGPLSYQRMQPLERGAPPSQQVGATMPFDADSYFGVTAQQTPGQGRTYGANVGGEGWGASVGYNPSTKAVNVGGGYQASFADGGPVYDELGNVIIGDNTDYRSVPGYGAVEAASIRAGQMGQAVGEPIKEAAAGIGDIPGSLGSYLAATAQKPDPSQRVAEDIQRGASAFVGNAMSSPTEFAKTVGGFLPVIGEAISAYDAQHLYGDLQKAKAEGDTKKADVLRQLYGAASAGAVPGIGIASRIAGKVKGTVHAAEGEAAAVRNVSEDLAKLKAAEPEIAEAKAITKEHEPPVVQQAKAEQPITGGNEDLQFTSLEKTAKVKDKDVTLTEEEKHHINALAEKNGVDAEKAQKVLLDKKMKYPESEGWAPFEVADFERDGAKNVILDENKVPSLKLRQEAYEFHGPEGKPPKDATSWDSAHVDEVADKLVKEVTEVADRSATGDKNADVIMAARNWYRAMRDRLRQEYGGFADTMADVLGTTSAQTGVRQNWENTIEVMSQFSRGAYDRALGKLDDFLKAGGEMGSAGAKNGTGYINRHLDDLKSRMPEALKQAEAEGIKDPKKKDKRAKEIAFQETQQGDFPLITKADGKTLFNANSPPTMLALLDKFRERKAGDAPKTPNFTGNLIGYSDKATIDVWAARLLRRLSGRKRLLPDAEQGVGGTVLESPLPSGIGVGGEFGFGQEVFKKAAEKLRKDPRFDGLGDDDLQAIAWFLEKEQWGKNQWTSKAGEGGSIELEANFAGVNDREALKELRRMAETDPTFAERAGIKKYLEDAKNREDIQRGNEFYEENKWILDLTPAKRRDAMMEREGLGKEEAAKAASELVDQVRKSKQPEKTFAGKEERLQTLTQRAEETSSAARQELERIQSIARRFTAGLSAHREATPATSAMFREGTAAIENVLRQDPAVIMSKATTSRGRYIDRAGDIWDEPSYDVEFVTRRDFDAQPVFSDMVKQAKKRDQDSMFLSEVVEPGTVEGANPGIEVYFTKKVDDATAEKLTELINKLKVDAGFTFVTDYKAKNRGAGGENVGEYVGLRLQYVPEFGAGREYSSHLATQAQGKMLDAIEHISDVDGVSSARYVEYDTQVLFRDQYDDYLTGNLPNGRRAAWSKQPVGQGNQAANRGQGVNQGADSGEVLRVELPNKPEGFAEGGPVGGQGYDLRGKVDHVLGSIAEKAHNSGLNQRDISYLLRKAATGSLTPSYAYTYAGEVLGGNTDSIMRRLQQYPRGIRVLSRLDTALGGNAGETFGTLANKRPMNPHPELPKFSGKMKRANAKPQRENGGKAMEELTNYSLNIYGPELTQSMLQKAEGRAVKLAFALNQRAKNMLAMDPSHAPLYKNGLVELNKIASANKLHLRKAFTQTEDIKEASRDLVDTLKDAKTLKPAMKDALLRMAKAIGAI